MWFVIYVHHYTQFQLWQLKQPRPISKMNHAARFHRKTNYINIVKALNLFQLTAINTKSTT